MSEYPAIIFITADQLRKDALSCYGCKAVDTPHLDRLASQGVRFTRAYTNSPWCLPSRTTMLTGLYPHNHRAYSNFRDCQIGPDLPNMYQLLRQNGYRTHHIGKCHYAPVPYNQTRADTTLPYAEFRDYYVSLGIDHLDLQDDKQVSVWFMDDYAQELKAAGYLEAYRAAVWNKEYGKVFAFPAPTQWHPDAWVGRKAVAAIENSPSNQPFFAWISFSGPHFPFDTPDAYLERVHEEHIGTGAYYAGEFDAPDRIHHTSYHRRHGIEGAGAAGRPCKEHPDSYWRELRRRYFGNVALLFEVDATEVW
jgi:arylsulfatase